MALMLAREYGIKTRVAIARTPRHEKLFQQMGAKTLTHPAQVVAQQLYEMMQPESE